MSVQHGEIDTRSSRMMFMRLFLLRQAFPTPHWLAIHLSPSWHPDVSCHPTTTKRYTRLWKGLCGHAQGTSRKFNIGSPLHSHTVNAMLMMCAKQIIKQFDCYPQIIAPAGQWFCPHLISISITELLPVVARLIFYQAISMPPGNLDVDLSVGQVDI